MRVRHWLAACAVVVCSAALAADEGPIATVSGALTFVHEGPALSAQLDGRTFDRLDAARFQHFDEATGARGAVARMVVSSGEGVALYDFRRNPPSVARAAQKLRIDGVFWQGDHAVLKTTAGWYRFERGTLTRLTSSKTIYH